MNSAVKSGIKKEIQLYSLIGSDLALKDAAVKKIKQEWLNKESESFNFDTFYSKDLELKVLQERILSLPVNSKKRIILIKDAEDLKEETKDFILKYVNSTNLSVILVLDFSESDYKDDFLRSLTKFSHVQRFKQSQVLDTFSLSRQIESRKMGSALLVLNQLLKDGEKPERIMGGLRYVWEKNKASSIENRRKLRVLLTCDIDIKTGKLRPDFALEKLVIKLCSLPKS